MKISTPGTITFSVLALIGALILVGVRAVALEAVYPVERAKLTFSQKVWTRVVGFFRGSEARAENVRLRREVASLSVLRTDIERLEAENDRLRQSLGYRSRNPEDWLAAEVLSSGGGAAGSRNLIRIGKGSLDGVRKGAAVVAPEGLVGRVASVTPHTAEIALVTDGRVKVACEIETADKVRSHGILGGGSEDSLRLRHLSDAAEVPPRSRVLTSGLGGVFPKGIEVGTLLDVRKDANGIPCEGEVLPAVDFSTLEDVFIRREK